MQIPRSLRVLVVALTLSTLIVSPTYAWNDLGHRLVAALAFRRLNPGQRDKIVAILAEHPRFEKDFTDKMPGDVSSKIPSKNEWLFQQAAIWPDIARGLPNNPPSKLRDTFHRPAWHFINRPVFLSDADQMALSPGLRFNLDLDPPAAATKDTKNMNVVQTIRFARKVLNDPMAKKEDKALMLSWLFHCVGDIHQVMHSSALVTPNLFPAGDHGGNSIHVSPRQNLHSLWDSFLGTGGFRDARNQSFIWTNNEPTKEIGTDAEGQLDESVWLKESYEYAKSQAYAPEILAPVRLMDMDADGSEFPPIALSEEYLQNGGRLCERRVIEAGFRLGAILKGIAGP